MNDNNSYISCRKRRHLSQSISRSSSKIEGYQADAIINKIAEKDTLIDEEMAEVGKVSIVKGMEHIPNIFISFDKYLFLEVINILI